MEKTTKLMRIAKSTKKVLRRRSVKIILAIFISVSILFLISNYIQNKKKEKVAEKFVIKKGCVSENLVLSGTIKAQEHSQLFFPTSGKLAWIGVREGDYVRKGQALASLDKTTLNAAYQQALNNVRMYEANVKATYDSLQGKEKGETFAEQATRTASEVAKDNAYDALKAAEYNLKNSTLIAPFSGFVNFVANPFAGVNVSLSQMQIEIINPETIYVEATADQNEIINIKEDTELRIDLDSFPNQEFKGKISFISLAPTTTGEGTDYKIKVYFIDSPKEILEKLKVGMTGDIKITLNKKENVLYAPSSFVKADRKGKYVFVGSLKNKVYIKTGIEGEEYTEIEEGVKEGDVLYD